MGVKVDLGAPWPKTQKWLVKIDKDFPSKELLQRVGQMGVTQLYEWTPKQTGLTAASWSYEIVTENKGLVLYWTNDNIVYQGEEKISVAAIIVNGHATLSGKWIEGRDYITPALEPVIKYLNEELTREAMGR